MHSILAILAGLNPDIIFSPKKICQISKTRRTKREGERGVQRKGVRSMIEISYLKSLWEGEGEEREVSQKGKHIRGNLMMPSSERTARGMRQMVGAGSPNKCIHV